MGRLCMTLLAMMASEGQGSLNHVPSLHSPLLTILLDVPWPRLMRSGWPLFGLLAQLAFRSPASADEPFGDGLIARYYRSLHAGLAKPISPAALAQLGASFVEQQEAAEADASTDPGRLHVMPALCALASQLLGPDMLVPGRSDAALQHMQGFFKQAVNSIA